MQFVAFLITKQCECGEMMLCDLWRLNVITWQCEWWNDAVRLVASSVGVPDSYIVMVCRFLMN